MQGISLCMLITALASLLMPILAVGVHRGQNGKCGKKGDKSDSNHIFSHVCGDNGENVSVLISF